MNYVINLVQIDILRYFTSSGLKEVGSWKKNKVLKKKNIISWPVILQAYHLLYGSNQPARKVMSIHHILVQPWKN